MMHSPAPVSQAQLVAPSVLIEGLGTSLDPVGSDYADRTCCRIPRRFEFVKNTLGGEHVAGFADSSFIDAPSFLTLVKKRHHNLFKNQVVIDLGAGSSASGYHFAQGLGARAYVAVEYCFISALAQSLLDKRDKNIPYAIMHSDIATVVAKLPNHSISFIHSAADDSNFTHVAEMQNALDYYLPRIIHPNGAGILIPLSRKTYNIPSHKRLQLVKFVASVFVPDPPLPNPS